ncbi:MAG: A24 family peptidase [Erythrobacter sp.]
MLTDTLHYGLLIALAIGLLYASFTDIRSRTIGNKLNLAIAAGAPLYWWASGMTLWPDVAWQLGFAIFMALILMGIFWLGLNFNVLILGGGDIKLLGAIALWLSPFMFLKMLIIMAVAGGILAVAFVARRIVLKPKRPGRLPYGVAITIGALWAIYPLLIAVPDFA